MPFKRRNKEGKVSRPPFFIEGQAQRKKLKKGEKEPGKKKDKNNSMCAGGATGARVGGTQTN